MKLRGTTKFSSKVRLTDLEKELMVVMREGQGEGRVRGFGIITHTRTYLKWITNKVLPLVQGTLLNIMGPPGWDGSLGENGYTFT